MTDKQALAELKSSACQACGKPKKSMQSFCRSCYYKLPEYDRNTLYTHISGGYAGIYERCKAMLENLSG